MVGGCCIDNSGHRALSLLVSDILRTVKGRMHLFTIIVIGRRTMFRRRKFVVRGT